MRCTVCGHDNSADNRFCISCGELLAGYRPGTPPAGPDGDKQDWLVSEVNRLRNEIERLSEEVNRDAREGPLRERPVRPLTADGPPAPPPPQPPVPGSGPDISHGPEHERVDQHSFAPSTNSAFELEARVGARWLAWVGVVILMIGSAFFLRLAYNNGWIEQIGLVVLGVVFGAVLIGLGEFWHRKYPVYAATLAGGGTGIIYLSVFAAHTPFELVSLGASLIALLLISVLLMAQAIRYQQLSLAVLSIGGAYLAPLGLVGVNSDVLNHASGSEVTWPVAYLFVVGLGVLYVSTCYNWKGIVVIGLVGSIIGYLAWYSKVGDITGDTTTQLWLTALFLIWVGSTLVHHYLRDTEPTVFDILLSVANAAFFALMSYVILGTEYSDWEGALGLDTAFVGTEYSGWMGAFALSLGVFYGILGYVLYRRSDRNTPLAIAMGVMALVLSAIAVPMQLSGPWITTVWFAASLALMAASAARSTSMVATRGAGLGLLALGTAWLLLIDLSNAREIGIDPVFNRYVLSFSSGAIVAYSAAALIRRFPSASRVISIEKITDAEIVSGLVMLGSGFITLGIWTQIPESWFALAWGVEAIVLGAVSFGINLPEVRRTVYGLLILATARALVFDSYLFADDYTIFWNDRTLAFLPVVVAIALGGITFRRRTAGMFDWEYRIVAPVLAITCNALLLWYLSAEVIGAISSDTIDVATRNERNVISLGLSVLWAGYAAIWLLLGVFKRWKQVRAAALLLLTVPVIKLFVFDAFALDSGYRVAVFMTLGFLLVAGGYLYQRYESAVKGFLFETDMDFDPVAPRGVSSD